jgi:predicted protein tyrosine phosphatase
MNILFVCTINRMRSLTAETIYKNDDRFIVKSAGTDKGANTYISEDILEWADFILVMEKMHRNQIRKVYPDLYRKKRIICLYIPDEYDYMDTNLIELLKHKFEYIWNTEINK